MAEIKYLLKDISERTKYKSVADAYQRNLADVIVQGSVFYIEGHGCPDRTYKLIIKETKRLYPELVYLYDVA